MKLNKAFKNSKEKLIITPTLQRPFHIVLINTIGPLPKSVKGNEYAVTIICEHTKYLVAIPAVDKKVMRMAKAIFEPFVLAYGAMKEVRTDLGKQYKTKTWRKF